MAIYSSVPPPSHHPTSPQQAEQAPPLSTASQTVTIDIDTWAASALQSLNISPSARGTGVKLSIPVDGATPVKAAYKAREREPLRRDSQKKREAVAKGKEGSRRRQRWENDRFLHVPNAQPPLPSDWEVHPTHPVHTVPYYLAPLWDAGIRRRAEAVSSQRKHAIEMLAGRDETKGRVPQDLKQKLKKSRGAKTLLQELEEEVRSFVREWERAQRVLQGREEGGELDSEDEEIVFVGRNGTMSDEQRTVVEAELERERLVFEGMEGDRGASFGRWLVHSIATYYGLSSRSITVGNPARREAYVGIKTLKTRRRLSVMQGELPRPLWGMI